MQVTISRARKLSGHVVVPGDKSISHRALMFGSMGTGVGHVENLGPGADVRSTVACLRALGADVDLIGTSARIQGDGLKGFRTPRTVLNCGNSGTTMRLLSGIVAGTGVRAVLDGDDGLRRRPMRRVLDPLRAMGADVTGRYGDGGKKELAPVTFRGGELSGADHDLAISSAQVKSALLLAGLFADGTTRVREPFPSRDHTERMLRSYGVEILREVDEETVWLTVDTLRSPWRVPPVTRVPGDPSSAAFLLAAAAVVPGADITLEQVSDNETRTGFLRVLQKMGLRVSKSDRGTSAGDPVVDLHAKSTGDLKAIELGAADIPALVDEVPVLAVVATQAKGTTTISGASELRHKESDRLAVTARFLRALGANIEEKPDGLIINGPTPLTGGHVESMGDHRIALAAAVAGLCATEPVTIGGAEWVDVSWPGFFDLLRTLSDGGVDVA